MTGTGDGRPSPVDSFSAFVTARSPALIRAAYVLTGDAHEAEDLLQTALYKAAKQWKRIEHAPEPYVRRILYHESVSRWRRLSKGREIPSEFVPDRVTVGVDSDAKLTLELALGKLTRKQRAVLVLRYYEDLSEGQTASMLGVRLGTVKSQTRYALMRLRELAPELAELVEGGRR